MTKAPDKIVTRIHNTRGLQTKIARACGIQRQAVHQWWQVPVERVYTVAYITGLTPEQIRPDIFRKRPRR